MRSLGSFYRDEGAWEGVECGPEWGLGRAEGDDLRVGVGVWSDGFGANLDIRDPHFNFASQRTPDCRFPVWTLKWC